LSLLYPNLSKDHCNNYEPCAYIEGWIVGYYVNIKIRKKEFLYRIKGINLGHQTYKFKGTCLSQTFSQHRIRKSSPGVLAILEPTAPKYFTAALPTPMETSDKGHRKSICKRVRHESSIYCCAIQHQARSKENLGEKVRCGDESQEALSPAV
jgi:hypothetical protein